MATKKPDPIEGRALRAARALSEVLTGVYCLTPQDKEVVHPLLASIIGKDATDWALSVPYVHTKRDPKGVVALLNTTHRKFFQGHDEHPPVIEKTPLHVFRRRVARYVRESLALQCQIVEAAETPIWQTVVVTRVLKLSAMEGPLLLVCDDMESS